MPIRLMPTLLLAITLALGACGTRGPLTLPPPQQKQTLAGKTGQTLNASVDTITTKEPTR